VKITPIQTSYKGYLFRSRLEARWAVFFDTLGIKWEYEKEGYDLGDAGRYLPDFWLPGFHFKETGLWVEIKPYINIGNDAMNKIVALCHYTQESLLLLDEVPDSKEYHLILPSRLNEVKSRRICFHSKYLKGGRDSNEYRLYEYPTENECRDVAPEKAIAAARSARFEHK